MRQWKLRAERRQAVFYLKNGFTNKNDYVKVKLYKIEKSRKTPFKNIGIVMVFHKVATIWALWAECLQDQKGCGFIFLKRRSGEKDVLMAFRRCLLCGFRGLSKR